MGWSVLPSYLNTDVGRMIVQISHQDFADKLVKMPIFFDNIFHFCRKRPH